MSLKSSVYIAGSIDRMSLNCVSGAFSFRSKSIPSSPTIAKEPSIDAFTSFNCRSLSTNVNLIFSISASIVAFANPFILDR